MTLLTAMALGIGVSFGASAGLVYNPEFTTEWFDAGIRNLTRGAALPASWTAPTEPDAVTVGDGKITLDTDLESPLSYGDLPAYSNVAVVAATFTVTPNAACPEIDNAPQAALTVVANGGSTNWVGLVGDNGTNKWATFTATSEVPAPVAGETYSVSILFDQSPSQRKIRYLVNGKYLNDWVDNPKAAASDISSVSFSGSGEITALAGTNIIETAATFNGQSFSTFAAALAEAEKSGSGWGASKVITLYKPGTFAAKNDGTFYFNDTMGGLLTITGGVYKRDGNAYAVTTYASCEAKIEDQYYAKFADAFIAATDGQTIEIQKQVADDVGALDVAKSLTLSGSGNLKGCTALTVAAGKTLTLVGALAVGNATVNGSVAGDALVVSGTLNGTAVESLTFAAGATFTYAGTVLAPTTLTLPVGGTVTVSFTVVPDNGAPIITASELDAAKFTGAPNGRVFKVEGDSLTLAPGATITKTDEEEGFDYTNGTVSVTASVGSGKTGTATLKVVDFATGNVITAYDAKTIGSDDLTWQLADKLEQLTPGGTYSYEVEVKVDDVVVATKTGTFTAAKWPTDIWFGADASKTEGDRELHGAWESTKKPAVVDNAYVIEDDALFNVDTAEADKGTNHVTRVDAVVTFESLVDADSLETESDALGGFVAAKSGDVPQWMALTSDGAQPWIALTGALAPEANVQYVVRAEIDFQSVTKRVRYLVSTDDGTNFYPLANGTAQWIPLADANKKTLAAVELKGAGRVAKFEAQIANKAVAKVGADEYESMDAALAAAQKIGDSAIKLLTNATIEPKDEGEYEISADTYHYVSGGKVAYGDRTIIVGKSGEPPVVRPSTKEMNDVRTPEKKPFKNITSLRAFLEKNGVDAYTGDDASATAITAAMKEVPEDAVNGLELWKDYALGIDKTDPVAPVTIPTGDVDPANITLAIPKVVAAIAADKPSGDYSFSFKVVNANDATEEILQESPAGIKIPLDAGTGTYEIKVIFTATPAND